MERKICIAFISAVCGMIAFTILCFNGQGVLSKKENRTLATKPYLFKDNRINASYFAEYDSYLEDRFGGREFLISLDTKIKYNLLHGNIKSERAITGKDGWFFYIKKADGDNLSDFFKENLMGEEEISVYKNSFLRIANWCSENGIKCIFLICPNKHSIYEECYPFIRPEGITRADQISQVFAELGIPYIYSRDYIISRKKDFSYPFYYETDTHWNSQGAYLSFTQLRKQIEQLFPDVSFPKIEYEVSIDYSMTYGDILPMLHIEKARSTQVSLRPLPRENAVSYTFKYTDGLNGISESEDKKLPKALVFRDSFFDALMQFVAPCFSSAEYIWRSFNEKDKEYILAFKPDIIIFECAERLTPRFIYR